MERKAVAVLSTRSGLAGELAQRCDGYNFVDGAVDGTPDVMIVDGIEQAGKAAGCRVVLFESAAPPSIQDGILNISRETFLADPESFLVLCCEIAVMRKRAMYLESELIFANEMQALLADDHIDAVLERVTRRVLDIVGAKDGAFLLYDPKSAKFIPRFSSNPSAAESSKTMTADVLERCLSGNETFVSGSEGGRVAIAIPVQIDTDLIGVVRFVFHGTSDSGSIDRAVGYLRSAHPIIANAYRLTRSNELAIRDDLTKAYNRRFFEAYLDEEIERTRRYGSIFTIIFLDLDDLKQVNKLYGHLIGSRTLQEVAKRILSAVRTIDKVVRFGGDEFCIILPETDQEQAFRVATRVRNAISDSIFHLDRDIETSVTASFGIATYPLHASSKEDLIRQADAAMYHVKSTTKNAIGVAKPATVVDAG